MINKRMVDLIQFATTFEFYSMLLFIGWIIALLVLVLIKLREETLSENFEKTYELMPEDNKQPLIHIEV